MKKIFYLIVSSFLVWMAGQNVCAIAQNIGNKNLSSYVTNVEMNIMYSNYDNKFEVIVPGVSDDKIIVEATEATVRKANTFWIIAPKDGSKKVTVNVYAEVNGQKSLAGSHFYRVKALPRPSAYLVCGGGRYINEGRVSKKELLNESTILEASYGTDGIIDTPYKISGFIIILGSNAMVSNSNHFTDSQRDSISRLKASEQVTITAIQAMDSNGKQFYLTPLVFTIQ